MTGEEIDNRAWQQMMSLSDAEVLAHPLLEVLENEPSDIWDKRIALRDKFYNELFEEVRNLKLEN